MCFLLMLVTTSFSLFVAAVLGSCLFTTWLLNTMVT